MDDSERNKEILIECFFLFSSAHAYRIFSHLTPENRYRKVGLRVKFLQYNTESMVSLKFLFMLNETISFSVSIGVISDMEISVYAAFYQLELRDFIRL